MRKISKLFELELAGLPPSVNQMYRTGRSGNRYKKPEVSEWQDEIAGVIREAWGKDRPYTEEVEVHVLFRVKGSRRWDVDNRLKALLDCLQEGGAIKDDAQISGIIAAKKRGEEDRTKIAMYEYSGARIK